MKRIITTSILSVGLLAFLATSPSLRAEKNKGMESPENAALIQAAYSDLTSTDRDYDGHREKAAKELHKFAKKHGIELLKASKGKDKAKRANNKNEPQAVSDAKLQDAMAKLQQLKGGKCIEKAIDEIQAALAKK